MNTKTRKRISWIPVAGMFIVLVLMGYGLTQSHVAYERAHHDALLWRDVVDSVPSGLIVADCDGNVMAWNEGATTLLGWEEAEIIGLNITFLMPDEDSRVKHRAAMANADMLAQLQAGSIRHFSCYALCKDGTLQHVHVRLSGIHDGYKYFLAYIDPVAKIGPMISVPLPVEICPVPIHQQARKLY